MPYSETWAEHYPDGTVIPYMDKKAREAIGEGYNPPYSVGQAIMYEGVTYVANTAIASDEIWTPAHWTVSNVCAMYNELKSNLTDLNNSLANYSRTTAVTSLATANGTFTATEAGYLCVYCVKNDDNNSSEYILQISGISVLRYRVTGDVKVYNSFLIPMSKGDTITCNTVTNMYQLSTNNVKFIPRM